ncbi:MAG: endo alpha-1,4 polygalactosaminidase [Spirochaetes bacterium]|jgi:cysteinyl-tRNA synthetase|nr:endo alpha-1,4 polygalactosaminidase [Spirochaetota bacterium]
MKIHKAVLLLLLMSAILVSCSDDNDSNDEKSGDINYRDEMRNFVIDISRYAKKEQSGFIIIPQNGIDLVTKNSESDGELSQDYLEAVDGHGQEDLLYGYEDDDEESPEASTSYTALFLDKAKGAGNVILVTDYCSTISKVDDSYDVNSEHGYVSFAAHERDLNEIPDYPAPIYNENSSDVKSLSDIQNFLYLINGENFSTKQQFIDAVTSTNYDLLIMDLFDNDGAAFVSSEISELKQKKNGSSRLVICYMSIGEAETYRYYWQPSWEGNPPVWLDEENPDWEGNFKVKYWENEWQNIIFGNDDSYLKMIIDAGFDGVYLDIIDAFEYYEN